MSASSQFARFGLFELDLRTGELRKGGRKLRLQEQSFRLLRLLLEQRGHAITRERLKSELWAADTFVDFDHGLNTAIAKLRQALGDSADNPRFIETMSRYGYRFIAPVEFEQDSHGVSPRKPSTESFAGSAAISAKTDSELDPVSGSDKRSEDLVDVFHTIRNSNLSKREELVCPGGHWWQLRPRSCWPPYRLLDGARLA